MWAYIYIFTTLYYRRNAPYYSDRGGWSIVDAWVRTFGPLPKHWHSKYNYYGQPCKDKWHDQTREPDPKVSLKVQVAKRVPAVDQREQDLVLSVLEKGFRYEPVDRITAAQLLQDPDFNELMEIYGVKDWRGGQVV
jgi:hypothetical protein